VPADFADEPAKLLDLVDLRFPLASIALADDARLVDVRGLAPSQAIRPGWRGLS
jgi:hypothetical protein